MISPEQLGSSGEEYTCHILRTVYGADARPMSTRNPYHSWCDIAAVFPDGRARTIQLKTKTAPTPRNLPWTCARSGARGGRRDEHGMESVRFDRYNAMRTTELAAGRELDIMFLDPSGLLLCIPEQCAPRFGCGGKPFECPQASVAGLRYCKRARCDYFVFFDRALMQRIA